MPTSATFRVFPLPLGGKTVPLGQTNLVCERLQVMAHLPSRNSLVIDLVSKNMLADLTQCFMSNQL
jgi:hypothetical protein